MAKHKTKTILIRDPSTVQIVQTYADEFGYPTLASAAKKLIANEGSRLKLVANVKLAKK